VEAVTIIPTLPKNKAYVELCVRSLLDTTNMLIMVVVNSENPEELEEYDLDIEDVRLIIVRVPKQGQCHAVNTGVKMLKKSVDYIFISNDDMYYAPGWLQIPDKSDYLCWSPNLVEPTNNLGSAPPFLKLDAGFTLDEFDIEKVDEFVKNQVTYANEPDETGFNFPVFIKKDLWDMIGGYDEFYDPWGSNSDTDLQTLIELAGVQPMRNRDSLVYHFSNKSDTFDRTHQDAWQRNFDYYREKFGYTRDDEPKPNTWMATGMVNREKLIFHPDWEDEHASS